MTRNAFSSAATLQWPQSSLLGLTTKEVLMPNSYFVVIGLCILATIVLLSLLAHMFRKAGPNEALIVYGFVVRASSRGTER
jgi:uncharacterized membrane protein YqiK